MPMPGQMPQDGKPIPRQPVS